MRFCPLTMHSDLFCDALSGLENVYSYTEMFLYNISS